MKRLAVLLRDFLIAKHMSEKRIFPPTKGSSGRSFLEEWVVRACTLCFKELPAYMFGRGGDECRHCSPTS